MGMDRLGQLRNKGRWKSHNAPRALIALMRYPKTHSKGTSLEAMKHLLPAIVSRADKKTGERQESSQLGGC